MKIKVNRKNIGIAVLALLAVHIAAAFPWRLATLAAETLLTNPSRTERMRQGNDKFWEFLDLESRLERRGWDVSIGGLPAGIAGMTNQRSRTIVVAEGLGWNERYSTLAHEGAHTLQPEALFENHAQEEVFAESVATLIAHDGIREHARYLARYKADILTMVAFWHDIYRAAEELTNG